MRRVKIKPCQYFIKFQKEASWSFFLTLTQNDLSVLQEIYLGSKEEPNIISKYLMIFLLQFLYLTILSWNLGICVQWEIYTLWLLIPAQNSESNCESQVSPCKEEDPILEQSVLVCYSML